MYCKNCGKEILEEFEVCPYCKTSLKETPSSYNQQNQKFIPYYKQPNSVFKTHPILAWSIFIIILLIGFFFLKISITSTNDLSTKWDQSSDKQTTTTTNTYPSTTNKPSTTTTLKNYQQIYDEYSQKLISAGPTSSINEMAEICNEGISKMAQYMYSASGTDGQYSTYQSWVDKLYNVYLNNCR